MLYLRGLHDARQLAGFDPRSWTGRRRRIAIDLIDEIDRTGDPAIREALFERIVDARGAFKRTYRDRFARFDALLVATWQRIGLPAEPIRFLDAAVSDGSTALPLIEAVRQISQDRFSYTATDLDGRYFRLCRQASPERRVIVSEAGEIVQIVVPPFLFTHRESRYLFPVNRLMRPAAERFAHELVSAWQRGEPEIASREILLFNPDFRRTLESDRHVVFRAWDILQPWTEAKVHGVRAMNVLNPGYFDAAQMRHAVRNLIDCLDEGGIIALGSNDDAGTEVDGVIGRRAGDRLEVLATSGKGFRAPDALAPLLIARGNVPGS